MLARCLSVRRLLYVLALLRSFAVLPLAISWERGARDYAASKSSEMKDKLIMKDQVPERTAVCNCRNLRCIYAGNREAFLRAWRLLEIHAVLPDAVA